MVKYAEKFLHCLYDNICMIVICLGNKPANELTGIMRMLTVLFLENMSAKEITEILEKEYSVPITPDLEKGVAEMCNLSEGLIQRGREEGFRDGKLQGFQDGKLRGFQDGEISGIKTGEDNFFNAMSMIKQNTPLDAVSKITGIDMSRLQTMRDMMFAP